MTSDAGTPSPSPSPPKEHELSPRKQRRSPEGCEDEEDDREDRKRPRHRHHSDRHREEQETAAEDVSPIELPPPLPLPLSGQLKGDDDEREEGEILEDDEEGFGDFMKEELDNSEPGEIKADKDDGGTDNLALASVNRVQTSPEGQYEVNAMSCDTEIVVEKHGFSDAAGKTLHKSGAKRMNGSIKNHDHATAEKYVKENSSVIEPDDKDKNLSSNDASRDRSKDDERCSKRKKREDQEDTVSDFESKRHRSHKQSESRDNHSRKRSVSRDSLKDRYKLREASPSYQKYYGESRLKEKSSRETRNEKNLSSGREKVRTTSDHEDLEYSKGDTDDHRNHTDSNEKEKQVRKERERSHSHSRHDSRGESHDRDKHISQGSRESDRYRDKDRSSRERDGERDRARLRDTNREKVKDDKREPDRSRDSGSRGDRGRSEERHAERRKSRDCDSHDRRSKYNDDREADRDRDRVEHRGRERSEGRHTERAKSRDRDSRDDSRHSKYYGERDTDRNKDRDRGGYREHDRSQGRRHGERGNSRDRDSYDGSRRSKYDDSEYHDDRLRDRKLGRHSKHSNQEADAKVKREEEEDYQDKVEEQLATQEDDDAEKILEESRRRRLAILEKYKQQQAQQQQASNSDNDQKENGYVAEDANKATEPSASAYPDGKMNDVDTSARMVSDQLFSIGKSPHENGKSVENAAPGGLGCGTPKGEISGDMFSDDIFGESPTGVRKMDKGENVVIERSGLHDNWDDAEGYYCYRLGEVLDGRYEVIAAHGKGVFSTVVRAKDLKAGKGDPEEVAIKIIRSNDTMYKAGMDELVILKKLAGADPENRRHCVRFLSSFKYRNHLCLVFESLHMNLREVLKKFGRNIGLKLTAVRTYAKQLFIALKHLKNCGVLHCDIKPDNMLVNDAKNVLKLCDFGNAMFAGKNEITPYLVSRFYRAPEIILGLAYDHPMDMWSVGCCLFELYNGKVLFPGPSNNDMLRLHMELKGPFPKKMLKKGLFTERHFDHDLNFHSAEEDPVTKKTLKRLLFNIRPKDIGTIFTTYPEEDPKMLGHFKDLLEKIFVLDPDKRLTVSQALSHPFITSK